MYHYKSCGLPSIHLKNGYKIYNGPSGKGVSIDNIDDLYKAIALNFINKPCALTSHEIKFLRIQLDFSERQLGSLLEIFDDIGKMEKGIIPIPAAADKAIRDLYATSLGIKTLDPDFSMSASSPDGNHEELTMEIVGGRWVFVH